MSNKFNFDEFLVFNDFTTKTLSEEEFNNENLNIFNNNNNNNEFF